MIWNQVVKGGAGGQGMNGVYTRALDNWTSGYFEIPSEIDPENVTYVVFAGYPSWEYIVVQVENPTIRSTMTSDMDYDGDIRYFPPGTTSGLPANITNHSGVLEIVKAYFKPGDNAHVR